MKTATRLLYLIGSLRNQSVPDVGNTLREHGSKVFDSWFAAGKIADDSWRDYEKKRGNNYQQALQGHAARNVFAFDSFHINRSHGGVLMLPAGKSGHLEAGILSGQGKPVWLLLEGGKAPARLDVMSQFLQAVCFSVEELIECISAFPWPKLPEIPDVTVHDAKWLAGLMEGDGTFCISGSTPRAVLGMTDKDVVQNAARIFGSGVWRARRLPSGKRMWACGVAGLTSVEWMRILRPMMGQRRQQQILTVVDEWATNRKRRKQDATQWRRWFGLEKNIG